MGGVFGHVRWGCRVGLLAMVLVLFVAALPAFAQLPTGTILGTVKDASGALVPGATVTAQNVETGASRSTLTNETGAYRLAALPVGHYDLRVELAGFKATTQKGLVLSVGDETVLNFSLEVGTPSQELVVSSEAPIVNTTTASLGGLVNEQKLSDLPLNGRKYLDLTLLQAVIAQNTLAIRLGGGAGITIYSS